MRSSALASAALLAASFGCAVSHEPTSTHDGAGTRTRRQQKGKQSPSAFPKPGAATSHGCYSSSGNFTRHARIEFMSSGSCTTACKDEGFWVAGLHGTECFCGYAYPPTRDVVDDKFCNYPCPGFDPEACGGLDKPGYWSVFNLGANIDAAAYEGQPATSSSLPVPTTASSNSPASTNSPATNPEPGPESHSPDKDKTDQPRTVGIAAGIVGGVISALLLGGIFLLRRKRAAGTGVDHQQPAATNDCVIGGTKLLDDCGPFYGADSRLDQVMANRRASDCSVADSNDYSRKILRVTNP